MESPLVVVPLPPPPLYSRGALVGVLHLLHTGQHWGFLAIALCILVCPLGRSPALRLVGYSNCSTELPLVQLGLLRVPELRQFLPSGCLQSVSSWSSTSGR